MTDWAREAIEGAVAHKGLEASIADVVQKVRGAALADAARVARKHAARLEWLADGNAHTCDVDDCCAKAQAEAIADAIEALPGFRA